MSKIIEIHIIKNYPFANLNRDEAGTPKTAVFGGVNRGRVSSQSLKHAWRKHFNDAFEFPAASIRTCRMPGIVRDRLVDDGTETETADVIMELLSKCFDAGGKNDDVTRTKQIVPFGVEEINAIVECAEEIIGSKTADQLRKEYIEGNGLKNFAKTLGKRTLMSGNAVDIALFGRMATTNTVSDVEAAMQVAHAISTHRVELEEDFFTAVDDIMTDEEKSGAPMMGVIEHDSCCYYEYMALNIDELKENLKYNENADEIIKKMIPAFIKTAAFCNPSGKSTTTGTNELPCAILVEEKEVPYNLCNAFVKPVTSEGEGLVFNSVKALADYCELMNEKYGLPAKRVWFSVPAIGLSCGDEAKNFGELLDMAGSL